MTFCKKLQTEGLYQHRMEGIQQLEPGDMGVCLEIRHWFDAHRRLLC
jgi:hypothetical protein